MGVLGGAPHLRPRPNVLAVRRKDAAKVEALFHELGVPFLALDGKLRRFLTLDEKL